MAKSEKKALAPKKDKIVRNGVVIKMTELEDGTVLAAPQIEEDNIPLGIRRQTRHMDDATADEEIFWLILETYLTKEEIAVWDSLTMAQLKEFQAKEPDFEKK